MFSISVKVTKRQVLAAAAILVVALAGGVWGRAALSELRGSPAQSDAIVKVDRAPAKTNEQRLELLASCGWEVDSEPIEVLEVMVPEEFDEVIENYNRIQQTNGCNLEKYAGKRCKRYTYTVTNYPGQAEHVRANLVVYNGKLIGGDICSLASNGFMHGLLEQVDTKPSRSEKVAS